MPNDFGFKEESVFLSLLLFTTLLEPFMEMIEIQQVAMVRAIEFKADKFSVDLGYGMSLRDGLIAIHVNN